MSPMPLYASPIQRDRVLGVTASFLFHACVFVSGGVLLTAPAEYAVESGSGGIEVDLTAAPLDMPEPSAEALPEPVPQDTEEETGLPQERPTTTTPSLPAASELKGDGSSSIPGQDRTTFHSSGGADTQAQPNYLRNPAPPYPREARENGWEGVVTLLVSVDKAGRATAVERQKSSGYDALDRSALKTVKSWRFRPARLGTIAVDSTVIVPVRFKLER